MGYWIEPYLRQMKWHQKPCIKMEKVIDRGKRSKIMSKAKSVEKINKNPLSFLEISPEQKEVLPTHKLQDHTYE